MPCRRNLGADVLLRLLSLNPVAHEVKYHAVDAGILEPAFLQVFAANKGTEGVAGHSIIHTVDAACIIAAGGEQLLHFARDVFVHRENVLRVGWEQVELVQLQEVLQLLNWLRAVIYAQVNEAVVEAAVASPCAYHEQRRRLLSPAISPCRLPGCQRRQQAITERAGRLLKGACHRLHRLFSDQNIALAGVILSCYAACPGIAVLAGIAYRFSLRRDDTDLAAGPSLVVAQQSFKRLPRRQPACQQFQTVWSVAGIGPRLGCDSSHPGLCPGDYRTYRQEL